MNSSLRSVPLKGPSRGGMFGCMAAQAQIIVVETHPQITLDNVRCKPQSTQLQLDSSRGINGVSAVCALNL